MNKRLLSLLLCFCLILPAFSACNPAPSDTVSTTTEIAEPTTTTTESTEASDVVTTVPSETTVTTKQAVTTTKKATATTKVNQTKATTTANTTASAKPTTTTAPQPTTSTLNLVVNGQTDYVIIRAKNSTASERNAASELQSYLKQITGCSIPVKTDDVDPTAHEIVVGNTNRETAKQFDRTELGTDGFVIKTVDKKLFLVGGGDRGTLYAVYEFLEAYLGCRFYTVNVEKVPQTATIALNPIHENKQVPVFMHRELHWTEYRSNADIAVKRKLSGQSIRENWGGCINYASEEMRVHTVTKLVNPDKYFAAHPEYYRMNGAGQREASQICLSSEGALQVVIEGVRQYLRDNPDAELISVSQMDNTPGNCYCDKCRATDEAESSPAGTMITFANKVARAIKDEFPNVYVHTLAYQYTRKAPKTVRPDDNVVVQLCSIECCFSHPLELKCDSAIWSFCDDLKAWAAICDNLYIWDYTTNYAHYNATFPNFNSLRQNVKLFADNNVIGVFEQGAYQTLNGEFSELRSYLLSKCLWDPYMSEAEYYALMDDFLQGVYGDGWQYVREYIDLAQKEGEKMHFGIFISEDEIFPTAVEVNYNRALPENLTKQMILDYANTDWSPFIAWYSTVTSPLAPRGEELFAKALAAAKTEPQKTMLERVSIQASYVASYYYYELYCEHVYDNINRLVTAYFAANPNGLTEEKIQDLAHTVAAAVQKQYNDKYLAYNQQLWSRMLAYRMILREGDYSKQITPNLSQNPSHWL